MTYLSSWRQATKEPRRIHPVISPHLHHRASRNKCALSQQEFGWGSDYGLYWRLWSGPGLVLKSERYPQ
jgi:hypothetical protein